MNNKTGQSRKFTSITSAAKYISIQQSYVAKILKSHILCVVKGYTIMKKIK